VSAGSRSAYGLGLARTATVKEAAHAVMDDFGMIPQADLARITVPTTLI
jgi:hypothetical protein